ncbi:hypothetical protein PTSG_07281 [Salpingoeca rosetta]|uniref:Uncharacterized protein n=1 Tax=Salpingoeca rosetta (strain ATCC 50818 / BSB-021) TaxID=946362 RepID=F2UIZ2_SALR5|nr:uncharacterized protein PTSG_07281 [Salpingoeca rosetta]EGD76940.1 hypothetical protein PTSG_07281 [Salpingoeca rosetta]|eukprot:XP_004990780.1 hypothetical protein PTSG_07281 [Salpingoeca rosetta]
MVRNGGADGQQRERRSHAVEEEQERWRQRHRVAGTAALPLSQFIVREHALRSGEQLDDDGNDVEADVRALRDAVPSSYQEYVESLEFKAYDADCSVLELVLNEHHAMWRKERLQEDHEAQFGRASLACQLIQNVHELLAVLDRFLCIWRSDRPFRQPHIYVQALRNEPDLIGTAAEELLQGAFDMLASPMPAPAAASRTNSAAAAVPHAPPPPPPPSSSSSLLAPQPPSRVLRSPRKPAHPFRRLASLDMARPLIPAGDSGDESERSVAEALVNLTEQQPPLQQEQQREAPDKAPGNQPQQPQPQQPPQPPQPQQPPQPPQQQHVEDVPRSESTPLIPTPTAATVPAVAKPTKQDNDNDGGGDGNDGDDAGGADTKTGDGGDTSADEGGIASEVAAMDDDDMDAFLSELHGEE